MRRVGLVYMGLVGFFFQGHSASAESSVDALTEELTDIQTAHQDASSAVVSNFLNQLDAAVDSPDAALALYQKAGGKMPDPAAVQTQYEHETPDERAAREAEDATNLSNMAYVVQLHCGLMRFAALFVVQPKQKDLQDEWIVWLKRAAQIYPEIKDGDRTPTPAAAVPNPLGAQRGAGGATGAAARQLRQARQGFRGAGASPVGEIKSTAVRSSIISTYLGFQGWGEADQASWSVSEIPELYRTDILTPLRLAPTADTLAAWDTYIAMKSADQSDREKWVDVDYPALMFDRGCDDYAIAPDTEKLAALVAIIKANSSHPKVEDMIARVHQLLEAYRKLHSTSAPVEATPAVAADPNVTVTTTQQGDMTIVTTHTNSAPVNPAPPANTRTP